MSINTSVPVDLEHWQPRTWDEIVGNQNLKKHLQNMVWCIRIRGDRSGFNTMVTGESRAGKTSAISFAVRCLLCRNLHTESLNPCDTCSNCSFRHHIMGNDGWEGSVDPATDSQENIRFRFLPYNCGRMLQADIDSLLYKVRDADELQIVYLDEVHRLARRHMDEQLLSAIDTLPAIWISSSARIRQAHSTERTLEKMFQNRHTFRMETQKPSEARLVDWLAYRCTEYEISYSDNSVLSRLSQRSQRIPGMALQVLNEAHKQRAPELTIDAVESFVFDIDEEM